MMNMLPWATDHRLAIADSGSKQVLPAAGLQAQIQFESLGNVRTGASKNAQPKLFQS
jgi:hypothetical protein